MKTSGIIAVPNAQKQTEILSVNFTAEAENLIVTVSLQSTPNDFMRSTIRNGCLALVDIFVSELSFVDGEAYSVVLKHEVYQGTMCQVRLKFFTRSSNDTNGSLFIALDKLVFKLQENNREQGKECLQKALEAFRTSMNPNAITLWPFYQCLCLERIREYWRENSEGDSQLWENMRTNLKIDEKLLKKITNSATKVRHGNHAVVDVQESIQNNKVVAVILTRFIEYLNENLSKEKLKLTEDNVGNEASKIFTKFSTPQ